MKTQVLRGTKQEILDAIAGMSGEVREVIVFVDEPAGPTQPGPVENILAGMEPYMVRAGAADYSREALYTRGEGE